MKRQVTIAAILVLFLLCTLVVSAARGQAVYGTIAGTVTDPQGAAVAGAKVTVTSLAKASVEEATTNESGYYTIGHLIPDSYKVHIEATGFKAVDVASVLVQVDSTARVDTQMQLGSVAQSVEVTGELPQLQTDRSDVSTTFTSQTVENIPIYNRNFTTLQLLSPGNQRMNGWNHAASENPQGSQQIMTQGQHFAGTGFELDGTDNQDPILGIIVINPNLEAINEVKITTQDYDAEFGKAIGLIATTQTKSGTNNWHGSVFDFERSNSNFARDPLTQAPRALPSTGLDVGCKNHGSGQELCFPGGNWNQFGGTFGGPIKKDKIFVFADYQGTRSHVGGSLGERIPTAAERGGDLSDLGVTIYDPYMTTDAAHTTVATDASGNPIFLPPGQRQQSSCPNPADFCGAFPGNIIPTTRLATQSQNLLKGIPVGASGTGLLNNFFGSGNNVLDSDNFDVRGDYVATTRVQVFGRYSFQQFQRSGPGLFGTEFGGAALPSDPSVGNFAGNSSVRNQSLAAGFDYTLNPTLLTDFRFGWFRYRVGTTPGGVGTHPATDAGIPGLNLDPFYTSGMPYFDVETPSAQNQFTFGYALGAHSEIQCNCPLTEQEYQFQFVNNWTKIKANHDFKFGADLRRAHNLRIPSDAHRAGQLDFNNDITQGPSGGGGSGYAGFLLGVVSAFQRYVSTSTNATEVQPRFFFYGQDTWRVSPKLTVNLGLRWEIYVPESAAGTGLGGWLDLHTGEVRVAGEANVNMRGNTSTDFTHLAPRVGVAYQIDPKTVLRMGYGRSYDIGVFGSIFGHFITQNLPVLAQQSQSPGPGKIVFTLPQGPTLLTPAQVLENNCNPITNPNGTLTTCLGPNGRSLQPNGVGANARPFNNRIPTVDAWNVSLQRQLTPTVTGTLAYVGNKGTHTFIGDNPAYNPNGATNIGYNPKCTYLAGSVTRPDPATCPNGAQPFNNLQPYYLKYGWTQGLNYAGNDASSNYESLQLSVEKRWSAGLSITSSYTYQHANNYDNNGCFNVCNNGNNSLGYGPSSDYRNSVFIFTEVYQLPFGHGKKWGADASRIQNIFIGGWSLNSTTNWSSGLPFSYGISSCSPEIGNGPCFPNVLSSIQQGKRSGDPNSGNYWFATTGGVSLQPASGANGTPGNVCNGGAQLAAGSWGQPGCDAFGSAGRNTARGPGFFNIDLGVFKDFTITERTAAQFQFQAFNVLNHRNLGLPNNTVDSSSGGSISDIAYGSVMRRLQFGLKLTF